MIEPELVENRIFKLLGCVFYGDPFHSKPGWTKGNEIWLLWERFGNLSRKYSALLSKVAKDLDTGYEIHIEPEEYKTTKNYYVFVGFEIEEFLEIPLEMYFKSFPKINYVKFSTKMKSKENLGGYIYREWMPKNNFKQAFPYVIESYNSKRFKSVDDPESEIDWYIPIKKLNKK
ncbi:MAG: GyrI-like domain-containing protein [Promethearchaeota archaeon]